MDLERLRHKAALFDVIANNSSDLLIVADPAGAFRYVSPACKRVTGYDADELMGMVSTRLVHPKDRFRFIEFLRSLGEIESCAYRLLRKDGKYVWIETTLSLQRDPATSEPIEAVAISRDITVRKRAEEETDMLEAVPNAMIVVGADGGIHFVNTRTEKLFAYSRGELLGRRIEMLVPERFRGNHGAQRSAFFAAPSMRSMEAGRDLFGLRKDGSEVPIEIGLNPIVTSEGRFVVASIIDITERIKTQELLRLLVEASPNAMIMVGADGLITLVNTQTENLFAYNRQELVGQPIEMLVPERFRGIHGGQRSAFFAAPSTRPMGAGRDLFGLRKDGGEVPIEIGLNPILTAGGQFVVASIIDITERIKAQESLRRSLAEKTTLLKEVHHRVKNNLQVICSLLSMQLAHAGGDAFSGPLSDAHSRILAMSLIHEHTYQSESLADLDFGRYIEVLADRLFTAYCVDPSHIRLELSVEPIYLNLEHAIPCGLILNELLSNSLKHAFRDRRGGTVRISLRNVENGCAELAVADNGIGFPEDFRWEACPSLGLQVVRALIDQIRANLAVSGKGGASFRFTWKLPAPAKAPNAPR